MNRIARKSFPSVLGPAIVLSSVWLGSTVSLAQNTGAPGESEVGPIIVQQATGPIEEVIVTGQRTYRSLLNEAARETEDFYMRLNEVLDDDDFRIRCRTETPAGTTIATRVCRTRYQEELLSRQALSIMQGAGSDDDGLLTFTGTIYDTYPDLARMHRAFEEEMLVAVNADPQLNASVLRLLQLKAAVQNYETPAQERRRERREAEQELEAGD
jgi:hypothetical protein